MDRNLVEKITGPLLIAYLVSWGFQGILCVQVYQYYRAFPNDKLFLKLLVYGVFLLEVVQSVIMTRDAFDTFVVGFADWNALNNIRLLWFSLPVLGGMVASICRLYLIYRLHVLSRSWIPTSSAVVLAVTAEVAALLTGVRFSKAKSVKQTFEHSTYISIGLWGGSGAVCDVFVAAFMVYYLLRQKANFKGTHARITGLIAVIVETGVLTATMSALGFLLFICIKHKSYFVIPVMIVAKLYSNTMLLAMNNRINIVGGRNEQERYPDHLSGAQYLPQWELRRDPEGKTQSRGNIGVREDSTSIDELGFTATRPKHGDHEACG